MYMTGFHSTLFGRNDNGVPPHNCLNLYFAHWTLHSRELFVCAMVGVVVLGIMVEGVSAWRSVYMWNLRNSRSTMVKGVGGYGENYGMGVRIRMSLFHGLQAFLGYILMLSTMTYSIELLLCTIIGLCIGYTIFYEYRTKAGGSASSSTNPCCDFMEDALTPLNGDNSRGFGYEPLTSIAVDGEEAEDIAPDDVSGENGCDDHLGIGIEVGGCCVPENTKF